jgi:hypothetical protein
MPSIKTETVRAVAEITTAADIDADRPHVPSHLFQFLQTLAIAVESATVPALVSVLALTLAKLELIATTTTTAALDGVDYKVVEVDDAPSVYDVLASLMQLG